jgi:signal recognition particle subunit SRP72
LVWLYQQTGQSEKAMETLDKAASIWKSDDSFASTHTPTSIVKQTAAFKLKAGRLQEAVEDYEQLVKEDPTDAQAVAGLIAAYAQVDPTKAEQYGSALPEIALNHIDVDTLEKIVPGVKRGYVKKDPNG